MSQVEKYAPLSLDDWISKQGETVNDYDELYKGYQAYIYQHVAMNLTRIAVTHALVLEKLEAIAVIIDEATSEDEESPI